MATRKKDNIFASKEFYLLQWLKSREQLTSHGTVVNFSQEEIASEYGSSPATVNKWLQSLKAVHCVEQKKKGTYHITKTGNMVIAKMFEIETIIGGKSHGH